MKQSIVGTKSMIVSPHYLASSAGNSILEKGGNAFDAAVAVSACLAVVYPHMTGLGGDSFWLMYHAKENKLDAYNGSGRSGANITRANFSGEDAIPFRGIRSILTVPGMVDSWAAVLERYGTMTLSEVLAPAIHYAEFGFPASNDQIKNTFKNMDILQEDEDIASIFLKGNEVPKRNEKFVQKDLANSLKEIARKGRNEFYKGTLAEKIVSSLQSKGGLLTKEDFSNHYGNWANPISSTYREYTMYQVPPNSQGFVGLMALNILENFELPSIPHNSYQYYHLLIESLKQSFQDRNKYLTDPNFNEIPLDHLLSKTYAKELADKIYLDQTNAITTQSVGNDTAYAAVVDESGNAVSFIQSIYFEFGSGIVAKDTGIILQNRGSFFSLNENNVNCLEPKKRTFHTLMPAMAFKGGKPIVLYGTQGGEGQPQTQTVIITRMLDYGVDPQTAINEPRFVWGRTWGNTTEELKIEGRVSKEVRDKLKQSGHLVKSVEDFDDIMGHANAILIDSQGFLHGGVDPRSDGAAIGR
ncbi:gamma-glutamyltransferase [Niallia hominis]|uniref:Glutathione hydrolase proenzyme n=1 Tax=Niallia hominis TaxID=3133173 RepID=A0ABV1F0S8_9BACI